MRRGTMLFTLFLITSCSSAPWRDDDVEPVDAGLLTYVPASEKGDIEAARAERARMNERVLISQREREQVESRLQLAKEDADVLDTRLDEARNQIEHTREFGTQQELEAAQARLSEVQAARRLARTKVRYYEDVKELADMMAELQSSRLELATARVELREAEAISLLDRPAAQEVDVSSYRERVRRMEDEVEMQLVDVRSARTKVDLRRDFLDDRARAVPASFRLNEPEPVDEMISLQPETDDDEAWMEEGQGGVWQQQPPPQQQPQQP